jgi:ribosomal protein L37E
VSCRDAWAGSWDRYGSKAPRFDFAHLTCTRCGLRSVMVLRRSKIRAVCPHCGQPHTEKQFERRDKP